MTIGPIQSGTEAAGEDLEGRAQVLRWYVERFQETKNAFYAAEAFLVAMHAGHAPPPPILAWLNQGFEQWSASGGTADLAKALSLKPGRGQEPVTVRLERERRNERLLKNMDALMAMGATRAQAADLARIEGEAVGLVALPAVETLVSMHARAKNNRSREMAKALAADRARAADFLARFDKDYIRKNAPRLLSML
jgi:hypothetical protein